MLNIMTQIHRKLGTEGVMVDSTPYEPVTIMRCQTKEDLLELDEKLTQDNYLRSFVSNTLYLFGSSL